MKRWRIELGDLAEGDRPRFLSAFVDRFAGRLREQFPPASGYQHEGWWWQLPHVNPGKSGPTIQQLHQMATWNVSRGRFWGLQAKVVPHGVALKALKVTINGYFPIFNDNLERIERLVEALRNRPGQFLWDGIILMPMLVLCIALLPLVAVYRLATLSLHSDVLVAAQQLETLWPEVQASWPVAVPLSRSLSLPVVYSLALALGGGATAACFWLAGLETTGENWRITLYVSGGILALVSFGMLIALIMTILGFEVEP